MRLLQQLICCWYHQLIYCALRMYEFTGGINNMTPYLFIFHVCCSGSSKICVVVMGDQYCRHLAVCTRPRTTYQLDCKPSSNYLMLRAHSETRTTRRSVGCSMVCMVCLVMQRRKGQFARHYFAANPMPMAFRFKTRMDSCTVCGGLFLLWESSARGIAQIRDIASR